MKKTILLLSFLLLKSALVFSQTVTFTASNASIPNPERGFYHQIETAQQVANFSVLDITDMAALRSGHTVNGTTAMPPVTLVLRLYYIKDFINADFTTVYLDNIRADMTAARSAGVKLILRFAYSNQNTTSPFNASKAQILRHISQLRTIFQNYNDVIATVQMGFLGSWGENFTTTGFGIPALNATNWQDRKDVFDALLAAVPSDRTVQVRSPNMKQKFVDGIAAPITSTAQNARIGHHNDCLLADYTDVGTFNNYSTDTPDTTTFKAYLQVDAARDVVIGGETCGGTYANAKCLSAGGQAENELRRFHYSFINADWSPAVLGNWATCLDDISKRLGYRFVLQTATYPTSATNNSAINIQFGVKNDGYAVPYNPRKAEFVLQNTTTNTRYYAAIASNPQQWQVNATTPVNESFCLNTVPNGTYDLFLNLPDLATTLNTNPNYSIQCANTSVWQPTTGYNKFSLATSQRIVVSGSGSGCASNLTKFLTTSVLPLELIHFNGQLKDKKIELNWTTANEINAHKFEIERSINGEDFMKIGELNAQNKAFNYLFSDNETPQYKALYYRLKMVDLDGTATVSKIISVDNLLINKDLIVFPNPATNEFFVENAEGKTIDIYDFLGRIIYSKINEQKGNIIQLNGLINGVYFLKSGDKIAKFIRK
jgi:Domain of unknown function (DUF4832)/Domain of unknown function (DUF4874)/Secretion system C-terminal sorting domain